MFSYHRILKTFGRSVNDKTLQCDCDIHPWEITINGKRWTDKIRLIGFIDVFFVISYSANDRFEQGIIVYKDKLALEELEKNRVTREEESTLNYAQNRNEESECETDDDESDEKVKRDPKQAEWQENRSYRTKSLGHKIELRTEYPKSWIQEYEIRINKPMNWALSKRVRRGLKPHSIGRLIRDVIDCGIITQTQFFAHITGAVLAGTTADDVLRKAFNGLGSYNNASRQALSNDNV
ncbi:hypothetical protein BDV25DRAFT_138786 [Aspergillus avenaceus]|uniref:Uncharacterized protein n=1 Tax=Aspergillus avenaceus TaxID=36643 RepID=A0A5N6TYY8_ASPAV|nr:hypothetical protein BDV25DRAFT_138786 [Aspergillus avenaceus]